MKIVISGVGETGFYLASLLLKQGHDLVLIEKNEKVYKHALERLDAQIILGDGANALTLEPLVDEDLDFFITVSNNDESNIIATLIARKFGAKHVISRICDPSNLIHPLLTDDPHVSLLNAEMAAAKDIIRLIGNPTADEIEFFAQGKAEMVKFHVSPDAEIALKPLKEVDVPSSWLVIGQITKNEFHIVSGETVFEPGDQVLVMGSPDKGKEIESLLGLHADKVKRVIIVGYNAISTYIARNLLRRGIEVRLIEENPYKAEEAAEKLNGVLVIQGEGVSEDILDQGGIEHTDYLLALTSDDEDNVLISLLAKEKNVQRVTALAQKRQYYRIIEKVGVDSVINPRSAMVDEIIRSIYHKHLSGVNIIEGGKAQAVEIEVKEKSPAAKKVISKVKLPKKTLIGAVVRDDKLIIPRGTDKLEEGDHIVVFTEQLDLKEIKKIFANER